MISVIVPTTSLRAGLDTARQIAANVIGCPTEAIVVVDGPEEATRPSHDGGVGKILYTGGRKGSYAARNLGAKHAAGRSLLFADDDCRLQSPVTFNKNEDIVVGAHIVFRDPPRDHWERWYQLNAFPQERFLKRFSFLPTIFLLVPASVFARIGGFNADLYSAGDMDFCRRASSVSRLRVDQSIVVSTKSRAKVQLMRKLKRQCYGQAALASLQYPEPFWRTYLFGRALWNLLGLSGVLQMKPLRPAVALFFVNLSICYRKAFYLFHACCLSKPALLRTLRAANSAEVSSNGSKLGPTVSV
jgi:hypothetical protein